MTHLQEFWFQIVGAITFILWLARLEGRATNNTEDLKALEQRLATQRREDIEMRQRDWGTMQKAIDEMRADIKKLLERNP
jgi:hypothetical protein